MIKKAKIKYFLYVSMASLLFISCVYGLICMLIRNSTGHQIENTLEEIEFSYTQDPISYSHDHFVALIIGYNDAENFSLNVKKSVGMDNAFIYDFTKSALKKNLPRGSQDNFFYKIIFAGNTPEMIISADVGHIISVYEESITKALIFAIILFLLVLLFNFIFSFWVFKPIKETVYKQKQFISDVSHELKTPVAIISANADVLSNTTNSKYLDSIKSQSQRIGVLVNDLLTLSSLDEGVVNQKKERFSVTEALLQTALPFDAVAFENKKFLKFNIDEKIETYGLREDFVKIVGILLDNAVKYSTDNTEIILSLKKDGNKIILSVFNIGCCIKTEDAHKLFERFYRADVSRSRELGGSGLGLSIAKSLAQRNHWKIISKPIYNKSMEMILTI